MQVNTSVHRPRLRCAIKTFNTGRIHIALELSFKSMPVDKTAIYVQWARKSLFIETNCPGIMRKVKSKCANYRTQLSFTV